MIYFKALELDNKPFVQWNSVAHSLKELQDLGMENDPLVLPENEVPAFEFGVCPLKVFEGQLVSRRQEEMDMFEQEFLQNQKLKEQGNSINAINEGTFEYNTEVFPLNETARLRYSLIKALNPKSLTVITSKGKSYILDTSEFDAFLTAYYSELLILTAVK